MDEPQMRFIGEQITVEYDDPPLFPKKPSCPQRFMHGEAQLEIIEVVQEWRNYERRGRMRFNMRPANLKKAAKRGSWGVGRFFFRVRVGDGRLFDIYYDRAPAGQEQRHGSWHLYREILS